MLFNLLLPSLFAAVTVVAAPAPDTDVVLDEAHGEMIKFKRDTILETRDLELAEMHGVNLTESRPSPPFPPKPPCSEK